MIFAIISVVASIPLVAYAIYASAFVKNGYSTNEKITFGIFVSQIIIGGVQAIWASVSSGITCCVICCKDKPRSSINAISNSLVKDQMVMSTKPVIWISTIQIIASIFSIVLNCIGIAFPNS